jgi:hypothetical protein
LLGLTLIGRALISLLLPLIGVVWIVSGADLRINLLCLRVSQRKGQRSH